MKRLTRSAANHMIARADAGAFEIYDVSSHAGDYIPVKQRTLNKRTWYFYAACHMMNNAPE